MPSKVAVVASVVLLVAGSWWWLAREPPRGFEAEEGAGVGQALHERRGDSQPDLSKPSPPNPNASRTVRKSGAPEAEVERSDSSRLVDAPLDRRERGADVAREAVENRGWSNMPPTVETQDRERGGEGEPELEEFERFKQQLAWLRAVSQEIGAGDPIDADAAGLGADDVDLLDMDRDRDISSSELERAQRRVERAEHHPVKNDLGDGEYPVEREDYRRPEWEFDAVDTNGDGLMDVGEYYSFLVDTERTTLLLDADGDRRISRYESGLSEDDFAALDRDDSGLLKGWEIRRAMALGALD